MPSSKEYNREYYKKNKDKIRVKHKEWHKKNKTARNEKLKLRYSTDAIYREYKSDHAKKRRAKILTYTQQYKKTHPCIDCGENNPIVLDFDHRDPKQKLFNICEFTGKRKLSDIIEEIEKCDVRCANCHRIRTYYQRLSGEI